MLTLSIWIYDPETVLREFRTMMFERSYRLFKNPTYVRRDRAEDHIHRQRVLMRIAARPADYAQPVNIDRPFGFWYGNNLDPNEVQRSLPLFETVSFKMLIMSTMNLEELMVFHVEFLEYVEQFKKKMGVRSAFFVKELNDICSMKRLHMIARIPNAKKYYDYLLCVDETIVVNGYELHSVKIDNFQMGYDAFIELVNICLKPQPNDNEFYRWLDETLCTDWNKMDEYGESYGGYWQYPEHSYERINAGTLSRHDNIQALIALPYPRTLIMWTINIGCSNRHESVRYTNTMCYIIEFYIKYLGLFNLKEMCIYELNCLGLAWPDNMIYVARKTIFSA